MGPLPESLSEKIGELGDIPTMAELGLKYREQVCSCAWVFFSLVQHALIGDEGDVFTIYHLCSCMQSPLGVMHFEGGETAALARLQDYFWNKVTFQSLFLSMLGRRY